MKRKNEVIETRFREWIEQGEGFVDWVQKETISYWDFNSCVWGKPGDCVYIAGLEQDKDDWIDLGYEVIDNYKGFVLLRK